MTPRFRTFSLLAVLIAGLVRPGDAIAGEADAEEGPDWYRVEIVVFQRLARDAAAGERFPAAPGIPEQEGTVQLLPADYEPDDGDDGSGEGDGEPDPSDGQDRAPSGSESGREQDPRSAGRPSPDGPSVPTDASGGDEETPEIERIAFRLLDEEARSLGDAVARLGRSDDIAVLIHRAWDQPGLPRRDSETVWLSDLPVEAPPEDEESEACEDPPCPADGDRDLPEDTGTTGPGPRGSDSSREPMETPPEPVLAHADARVFGTLRVARERYLHLDVDLLLRSALPLSEDLLIPETASSASDEEGSVRGVDAGATVVAEEAIPEGRGTADPDAAGEVPVEPEVVPHPEHTLDLRLQDSRRMRSGEVHLLDHPYLGVIALVTPLPEEDEGESGSDGAEP